MNIIQVCPYDLSIPGGVQTHITHLSNQLVRKNHRVKVFAPSLKKSGFERKFDCEVEYITGSVRVPWWGTSIDVSVLTSQQKREIWSVFSEFKPDVIHFHTIWNPVMQTQLLWMLPDEIRKVGTFHDTPPDRGLGKHIGANLMKLGARYYLPKMDEIISVSETQARAMGADPGDLPGNFRILPNGIDAASGRSKQRPTHGDNEFRIIFVGRFEERKGIFELLEVYRRLQDFEREYDLSLTLLGRGPQTADVKDFIENHELRNVKIFEQAGDQQKEELLMDSDLMVAPALYGESFGIVLLEAMALGTKVAGYGNEGYLSVGREYGAEHFPPPGDREALLEVIRNHIENPERTDHLIERGLEIAAKHDWKIIANEIEKIYQR